MTGQAPEQLLQLGSCSNTRLPYFEAQSWKMIHLPATNKEIKFQLIIK